MRGRRCRPDPRWRKLIGSAPETPSSRLHHEGVAHIENVQTHGKPHDTKGTGNDFCSFVPVSISKFHGAALMDSGNLFRTCISLEAAQKMGLKIQPTRTVSVGTASKHAELDIVGETAKILQLKLGNHKRKFKVRCICHQEPEPPRQPQCPVPPGLPH